MFSFKKQTKEISWFRNALYSFLLYRGCTYLYHFKELFSNQAFIYHKARFFNPVTDLVFYLNNHHSEALSLLWILAIAILSILGICKKSNYISNTILWVMIINLTNFLYPTLTAGDYLLNQLLFFNIFFSFKTSTKAIINDIKTALHNIAHVGIKMQICFAYFLAGWFKINDPSWQEGLAVYQTFQINEYSNSFLASLPFWFCTLLTYLTISYQLLFPALIWFRPLKIYLMAFGIIQHLIIAIGMGLFSFGIIMIISYILFLKYDYRFPTDLADGADK